MTFKYYLISMNLSILMWPAANILDSIALGEQKCFAAYDVFANWALPSFEFYTYLPHRVRSVQKQRRVYGGMDFNGNEIGDEVIESDEKKKNVFDSRNYFEKKKIIVKQVVSSSQCSAR